MADAPERPTPEAMKLADQIMRLEWNQHNREVVAVWIDRFAVEAGRERTEIEAGEAYERGVQSGIKITAIPPSGDAGERARAVKIVFKGKITSNVDFEATYNNIAAALQSERTAAASERWQPIETAPAGLILGIGPAGYKVGERFDVYKPGVWDAVIVRGDGSFRRCTDWQPLPAPPLASTAAALPDPQQTPEGK